MSELWGTPSPYKPRVHLFSTTLQFNDHGQVREKLGGVSNIISKCQELCSTNGLKLNRHFPALCKFCIRPPILYCQASHREVSKRNSTKRWTVGRACCKKVAVTRPKQIGAKSLYYTFCRFSTSSKLIPVMSNIFGMKHDVDSRAKT